MIATSPQLEEMLKPLAPWRHDPAVEEICLEPGAAFIWRCGGFSRHDVELDACDLEDIAIVAGAHRRQDIGRDRPLLGTDLPGLGRIQAVLPPCVADGQVSLTIRLGAPFSPTIEGLAETGMFARTAQRRSGLSETDERLADLYRAKDWRAFFPEAVRAKKTIVATGATASGKTTFLKSLISAIPPDERLISVEDSPEYNLSHPNKVALFYAEGGQDATGVTAAMLVKASLRMRPSRILLQELRDGPATLAFLHTLQSGHPGGLTSLHATSAEAAFDRMRLLVKGTQAGAAASDADVNAQLRSLVDVVVHCSREGDQFQISEVWTSLVS
jgi:type IV secretion system protein VirB11